MGDFLKDIVNNLYPWHIHLIGAIIAGALLVFFWFTFWGIHKYTNAFNKILGRDDRIKELQEKIEQQKQDSENNELIAHQVSTALFNIKSFVETLNEIRVEKDPEKKSIEAIKLIQRILDQLSNDVKVRGGAQHRCGIWIISDDGSKLILQFTSFGFPRQYKGKRELDIHDSIAGRTFSKKQKINIDDVQSDRDWKPSPYTETVRYKSLICIPLAQFGVLTIDGAEPMSDECELIGEVYASLIETAVIEHDEGYNEIRLEKIFEEYIEDEEDVG
jgi:hypothetical protein